MFSCNPEYFTAVFEILQRLPTSFKVKNRSADNSSKGTNYIVWPCYFSAFASYSSLTTLPLLVLWPPGYSCTEPVCLFFLPRMLPPGIHVAGSPPPLHFCSDVIFSVRLTQTITILFKLQPPPFPNSLQAFIFLHGTYNLLIHLIIYLFLLCAWLQFRMQAP